MGDLRAADRVRARGRDPAPADRPLRAALPAQRPARRAHRGGAGGAGAGAAGSRSTCRAGRALALVRCAREVAQRAGRPVRPGSRARLAAPARDSRHRHLDGPDAGAERPGPTRPAAGRRPRLPEARRAGCSAAIRERAPPRRRSRSSSRRTSRGPGWRARTRCAPARAGRRCGSRREISRRRSRARSAP